MTTAWAHLPNAIHIDRVLDSLKSHPEQWMNAPLRPAYDDAYYSAWNIASNIAWGDAYYLVRNVISRAVCTLENNNFVYNSASGAVVALMAYDDSAHLLESSPEEIRLLIALGHPYAVLLLDTITVLSVIGTIITA